MVKFLTLIKYQQQHSIKAYQRINFFKKSTLFFLLETNVQVSLKLLGLLMNAFKNLISIRIDIKVHFFIIMCGQLDWIIAQHIVNNIVIFKICRFSWNDMDHEMLDW